MITPRQTLSTSLTTILGFVLCAPAGGADSSDLAVYGPDNIRESMIAFVNLSTAPGLDGATFRVDSHNRDTDLVRGSLGYTGTATVRDTIADAYWGIALAYADAEDELRVLDQQGRPAKLDGERSILSLRSSAGLNLPLDQHFSLRPYLSVAVSRLETDTRILFDGENVPLPEVILENSVDALTTSATLEVRYDRWFGTQRIELSGQYTAAYTDTFNGSDDLLDTWGWNETVLLRSAYSWDSGHRSRDRPWRWKTYANYTRFPGLDKDALGFTYYTELGLSFDYEWNIRPLDWFGVRFIGLKFGLIYGNDVRGISAGLSF